ncbi:hypothetical protein KNU71_gp026 [Streptomyces phage Braelyn]|uniref:Uncharacterized protein n=1 Tax=Streptomyces phage Braelyn TaxID=2593356 RepID=A0A514U1Q5_9CAUD|nr:hypothetical protein KNU71_gp026 [Streptomyces phage Braelyn]UGL63027.1 hypothetical protein SEA_BARTHOLOMUNE_26 [Streptomyces phage Bartholomune]UOW93459.1 hypothetical protein SEA_SQUILLIUM_26 [Streptomyces phage Squillium]WNM73291.1 hypothetical protein SEA_LIANDRY_26 [Streptomyces phage Liandry]WNM74689.1 hypothetical protein SEA_PINKIEPIE_26 [Streptomyces phage PinkiePie]QDK02884.1 hypothetical protein SEA_BRAELYN_26 [Streptomyces phage Braelyn]
MDREKAEEVLDLFLFEDIDNNRNHYEDTHDITWVGNHFAVRERATGIIHTFKVEMVPSDLPANEWIDAFEGQEWLEE